MTANPEPGKAEASLQTPQEPEGRRRRAGPAGREGAAAWSWVTLPAPPGPCCVPLSGKRDPTQPEKGEGTRRRRRTPAFPGPCCTCLRGAPSVPASPPTRGNPAAGLGCRGRHVGHPQTLRPQAPGPSGRPRMLGTDIFTSTHTLIHTPTGIYIHVHVCPHRCVHVCMRTHVDPRVHESLRVCTQVHECMSARVCMRAHVCVCVPFHFLDLGHRHMLWHMSDTHHMSTNAGLFAEEDHGACVHCCHPVSYQARD